MKIRALSVAAVLVLAGCGGTDVAPADEDDSSAAVVDQESPSATPTEDLEAESDLPDDETLEQYFDGVAMATLDSLDQAIDAALPGSPAAAYATYLRASQQSYIDGGGSSDSQGPSTATDDGFEQCVEQGSEKICYEYSDIAGKEGKVVNFSVNDRPIKDRLALGNGKPQQIQGPGGQATFLAAFETSATNRLLVVASLKSPANTGLSIIGATYRSVDGRQSETEGMEGPTDLAADSLANYTFSFPSAKIGGDVTIKLYNADFTTEGSVTFKTK